MSGRQHPLQYDSVLTSPLFINSHIPQSTNTDWHPLRATYDLGAEHEAVNKSSPTFVTLPSAGGDSHLSLSAPGPQQSHLTKTLIPPHVFTAVGFLWPVEPCLNALPLWNGEKGTVRENGGEARGTLATWKLVGHDEHFFKDQWKLKLGSCYVLICFYLKTLCLEGGV